MSNVLYEWGGIQHFQMPHWAVATGALAGMTECDVKLYVVLLALANQQSRATFKLTNQELQTLLGCRPNAIRDARLHLANSGLVRHRKTLGNVYEYQLCHPETGEPLKRPSGKGGAVVGGAYSGISLAALSPVEYETYFRKRLPGATFAPYRGGVMTRCPFHDDENPSLSINFDRGQFYCFTCKQMGGLIDFELASEPGISRRDAFKNIVEAIGIPPKTSAVPEVYSFVDEYGEILYEKLRYPGKLFRHRRPSGVGNYIWNLDGVRRVLYRLPQLIDADVVIFTEGERDANNVAELGLLDHLGQPVAVTTSGGVGSWRREFVDQLAGKVVVILRDMDEPGRRFAEEIHADVIAKAAKVQVVGFDNPEIKDVSDYLISHSAQSLISLIGIDLFQAEPEFVEA